MPAPNSQLILFLSLQAAESTPCPQAFLDHYKLIKTPATEEAEAVYYTEADGLNIHQAIQEYGKLFSYWNYDAAVGGKPVAPQDEILDENDNVVQESIPATYISFTLVDWTGVLLMTLTGTFQAYAQATGQVIDPNIIIQSRDSWKIFASNT